MGNLKSCFIGLSSHVTNARFLGSLTILLTSITAYAGGCEASLNNLVSSVLVAQRTSDEMAQSPSDPAVAAKWKEVGAQKKITEQICKDEEAATLEKKTSASQLESLQKEIARLKKESVRL